MHLAPTRLKKLTLLLFAVALISPANAGASDFAVENRSEKEQIEILVMMLSGHHYKPSRKVLARIGTAREIARLLILIVGHKNFRPTVRVRAAGTLYVFPTPDVKKFLLSVVHERSYMGSQFGTLLRKQAIRSLGRGYGKSVVPELLALRTDRNSQLREGVAHALGDTGAREALAPLKAWLPNEKELFVRMAIDRAIDVLRKRGR